MNYQQEIDKTEQKSNHNLLKAAIKTLNLNLEEEFARFEKNQEINSLAKANNYLPLKPVKAASKELTTTNLQAQKGSSLSKKKNRSKTTRKRASVNDYLESSAKLLDSLEDKRKEENARENQITPLFISSISIVILSSLILFTNSQLGKISQKSQNDILEQERIQNQLSQWEEQQTEKSNNNQSNLVLLDSFNFDVNQNLDNINGFGESSIIDTATEINTFSSIRENNSSQINTLNLPPTPEISLHRVITKGSPDLATALLNPVFQPATIQPLPITGNQRVSSIPIPPPPPSPRQTQGNTNKPTPSANNLGDYYVIAEYTGEESYNQAQRLVKDAFLTNFPKGITGIYIQMGVFNNLRDANRFAAKIKQQGVSVSVYNAPKD